VGPDQRKAPAEDAVREQLAEERERMEPEAAEEPAASDASAEGSRQDEGSDPADEPESESEPEPEPEPEDPLTALQRERDEYLALAQRAQADFDNYRKRAAREAAAATQRAKSGLVGELLPVVDNLERALGSAAEGEEHLAAGVKLVHSELVSVLNRNGVEQFDPAGEKFDPAVHEALSTREQEGSDSGVVLDVVEKGYRLNGNVLRPARVVVSG
jgi:molecular chaperone GrpE